MAAQSYPRDSRVYIKHITDTILQWAFLNSHHRRRIIRKLAQNDDLEYSLALITLCEDIITSQVAKAKSNAAPWQKLDEESADLLDSCIESMHRIHGAVQSLPVPASTSIPTSQLLPTTGSQALPKNTALQAKQNWISNFGASSKSSLQNIQYSGPTTLDLLIAPSNIPGNFSNPELTTKASSLPFLPNSPNYTKLSLATSKIEQVVHSKRLNPVPRSKKRLTNDEENKVISNSQALMAHWTIDRVCQSIRRFLQTPMTKFESHEPQCSISQHKQLLYQAACHIQDTKCTSPVLKAVIYYMIRQEMLTPVPNIPLLNPSQPRLWIKQNLEDMVRLDIRKNHSDIFSIDDDLAQFQSTYPLRFKKSELLIEKWNNEGRLVRFYTDAFGAGALCLWTVNIRGIFRGEKGADLRNLSSHLRTVIIETMPHWPVYVDLQSLFDSVSSWFPSFCFGDITAADALRNLDHWVDQYHAKSLPSASPSSQSLLKNKSSQKYLSPLPLDPHQQTDPWFAIVSALPLEFKNSSGLFAHESIRSLECLQHNQQLDGTIIRNILTLHPIKPHIFICDEAQYGSQVRPLRDEQDHRLAFSDMEKIPPGVTRVIMPIRVEKINHWVTVLVDINESQVTMSLADSLVSAGVGDIEIYRFVKRYITLAYSYTSTAVLVWPNNLTRVQVPQQIGGDDCGIHCVHHIINILDNGYFATDLSDLRPDKCNLLRQEYTRQVVESFLLYQQLQSINEPFIAHSSQSDPHYENTHIQKKIKSTAP